MLGGEGRVFFQCPVRDISKLHSLVSGSSVHASLAWVKPFVNRSNVISDGPVSFMAMQCAARLDPKQ